MGDPNLKADTARIQQCADDLKRVHDEFAHNADPARGYGTAVLGSSVLTSAFEEFADNWKSHRDRIKYDLKELSKQTATAAKTYEQVDSDLAKALRDAEAKARAGGGKK